jgi:hypothetical protein
MNIQKVIRLAGMLAIVAVAFVTVGAFNKGKTPNSDLVLKLEAPPFVKTAYAEADDTSNFDLGAQLDQEAGISAYYKAPDEINLNQVRDQFRTIEMETANFVIGSVGIPGYFEHSDAHVYVNTNGWILAYYLKNAPISKMIDVKAWSISTTKLKSAISVIAGAAGAPFTEPTYYDFRYPNATNILLVAEDMHNGNDFTIQLPTTYGYFERSWAAHVTHWSHGFTVNGTNRPNQLYDADNNAYGSLNASELMPGVTHTITAWQYGVLVIIYRVP